MCFATGVQPHVHVLFPGPGTGHPAGGQRLAAQGRHRVSRVRGPVRRLRRRRRQFRRLRRQVQTAVGRTAHRPVSPGTARVRRHRRGNRHGGRRGNHGNRGRALTTDLHLNVPCDVVKP